MMIVIYRKKADRTCLDLRKKKTAPESIQKHSDALGLYSWTMIRNTPASPAGKKKN